MPKGVYTRKHRTPEQNAKNSAAQKKAWLDPKLRAKQSLAHKGTNVGPNNGNYKGGKRMMSGVGLLTVDEYNAMFVEQNGCCAICEKPETYQIRSAVCRLAIDHNHSTGKVRGLLCHWCNLGVESFKDDINKLKNAIKYLKG